MFIIKHHNYPNSYLYIYKYYIKKKKKKKKKRTNNLLLYSLYLLYLL